jgi:peptidoglycan/LPS O-acetylase OafA/YrhL
MIKPEGRRFENVDTMRGLACIMLVLYHVISGLRLSPDHVLVLFNGALSDMRMPMFAFLSGFVLLPRINTASDLFISIRKKARRLLLPLLSVGTLHWCLQEKFSGEPGRPLWQIAFFPFEHFWFLQATFLVLSSIYLICYLFRNKMTDGLYAALFAVSLLYVAIDRHPDTFFSAWEATYLAPFILAGVLIRTKDASIIFRNKTAILIGWVAVCCMNILASQMLPDEHGFSRALDIWVGMATCLMVFSQSFVSPALATIGRRSYAIFLFHAFFTVGSRIIIRKIWPDTPVVVLAPIGLAAGLVFPFLLQPLIMKSSLTALLFLGIDGARRDRRRETLASGPAARISSSP